MKRVFFSVIIPVFNSEEYIERCLDSILANSFSDFEIIVIDDGSSDCSFLICEKYACKDERINLIHTENKGVSCARNIGLKKASGKYICFVDSDDWIEADYFEKLFFEASRNSFPEVILFDYKEVKKNCVVEKAALLHDFSERKYLDILYHKIPGMLWFGIYKSSLLAKNNLSFDESLKSIEDWLLKIKIFFYAKTFFYLKTPLYNYNLCNSNSLVHSIQKTALDDVAKPLELARLFLEKKSVFTDEDEKYICAAKDVYIGNYKVAMILRTGKYLKYCLTPPPEKRFETIFKDFFNSQKSFLLDCSA